MALQIKSTKDVHLEKVSILVYGQGGAGKTTLIKTLDKPFVISVEGGLLAISETDIPYAEVKSVEDLEEVFEYLMTEEAQKYKTICLDSISEIAEMVLSTEKKGSKDPRQAYGALQDQMMDIMRAFRDQLRQDVYFSCKMEKEKDEQGKIMFGPSMPGTKLPQAIPYLFDEILALRVEKNSEGESVRALMCDTDGLWTAKDRSGKLDLWEAPDLGEVIAKIRGKK